MSSAESNSTPRRKETLLQRHDAILEVLARADTAGLDVVGIHRGLYALGKRFCARTIYSDLRILCQQGLVRQRPFHSGNRSSTCYDLVRPGLPEQRPAPAPAAAVTYSTGPWPAVWNRGTLGDAYSVRRRPADS